MITVWTANKGGRRMFRIQSRSHIFAKSSRCESRAVNRGRSSKAWQRSPLSARKRQTLISSEKLRFVTAQKIFICIWGFIRTHISLFVKLCGFCCASLLCFLIIVIQYSVNISQFTLVNLGFITILAFVLLLSSVSFVLFVSPSVLFVVWTPARGPTWPWFARRLAFVSH